MTDRDLIREFVDRHSEEAFAELVRRHINLVYSVALRYVGNGPDAQDVTQAVFIVLARKAPRLRDRATLTGWLYETTRFSGGRMARSNARRHTREQEAYMQSTLNDSETDSLWRQVAPLLEEAMSRLGERDRTLLALRYFENRTGAETAALLGIQQGAAHKGTERALKKLRDVLSWRGIDSTPGAIAAAILAHSVHAAPAGLAKSTTAVALGKGAAAGASTLTLAKGALKFMAWSTAKTAIVSAVIAGMAALLISQRQVQARLNAENESLREHLARLQTENEQAAQRQGWSLHRAAMPGQPAAAKATNLYDRLKDLRVRLTAAQVQPFLKSRGRSAASLLAAFRTTHDPELLKEAMRNYPNDPRVAFEAVSGGGLTGDEKRQWLDAFEKSAPDNALGNCLSALDYFNSGQTNLALQELTAASGKQLNDYNVSRVEDDVEVYLAAGYSLAESKQIASSEMLLPQLSQVKQMSLDAVAAANAYTQSGDTASAQAVLQSVASLGQQYADPSGPFEITQLVGIALQKIALNAMDPSAPYGDSGMTVQDEINQLTQQRAGWQTLNQQAEPLYSLLTDQDWVLYRDRALMFGEQNALQWLIANYGQSQQ